MYVSVIALLALGALANFYRNRDPYKAYFYSRADHYLTTHLMDSDLNRDCLELEYRMQGKVTPNFFQAIRKAYKGKQLVVPNDFFFDINTLAEATGKDALVLETQQHIPEQTIDSLLRQGECSFFYSPLFFSPLKADALVINRGKQSAPCLKYKSPWKNGDFPLLMILMPAGASDDPFINVIHHDKYLFFIPSRHPALESKP